VLTIMSTIAGSFDRRRLASSSRLFSLATAAAMDLDGAATALVSAAALARAAGTAAAAPLALSPSV
jgi:hypothetical protein